MAKRRCCALCDKVTLRLVMSREEGGMYEDGCRRDGMGIRSHQTYIIRQLTTFALLCRDRVRANDCATPTGEVGEVGEGVACSHDGCIVHNWAAGEEVMAKAKVVRGGNCRWRAPGGLV